MMVISARRTVLCLAALFCWIQPASLIAQAPPTGTPTPSTAQKPAPKTMPPAVKKAAEQFDRAIKLHKARKVKEAITAYKEFLQLCAAAKLPPNAATPAYKNLADLYQFTGNRKGQIDALQHIVKADSKDALALARLATLVAADRRYEEAKRYAQQALQLKPPAAVSAQAHFALGSVASAKDDYATAEKEFGRAAKEAPENPQAHFNQAIALGRLKQYVNALDAAIKAKKLAPKMVEARLFIAALHQQMKQLPAAIQDYEEVLRLDPKQPQARFNRAALMQQVGGHVQEAISGYLNFLEDNPNSVPAQMNVAQLYYGLGNFTAAKQHYAIAAKFAPRDPRPLNGQALCELQESLLLLDKTQREEGVKKSETHFKQALVLAPKDNDTQAGLAYLYERTNRFDEAIAMGRKRLAAEPDNVNLYHQVARLYKSQRKIDEAVKLWKEYRQRKPSDPTSYAEAADALAMQDRKETALAEWKALLARQPKSARALLASAVLLRDMKRPEEARAQYRAVLALDRTGSDVPDPKFKKAAIAAAEANYLEALRGLAQVDQTLNKYDDAIQWWNQVKVAEAALAARTNGQPNPATYRAIAYAYEQAKKPDLAAKEYLALAEVTPKDPSPLVDLARLYESQSKLDEAVGAYRQAATRDKDPVDALLQIGLLYRRHNKNDLAIAEYEKIRQQYPNESRLLAPLAQSYEMALQDDKALVIYDALLKADPRAQWAEEKRATVLIRLKRFAEARAVYEKTLERLPENYQTYADLGRTYTLEGKADAFLAWLKTRLEKTPSRRIVMGFVIDQYIQDKREEAGWAYVKSVAEKHEKERPVQETYASLLTQHKRNDEALAVYRRVAAQYPKDLTAQMAVVDHLDLTGKADEATKQMEALIRNPDLPAAQRQTLRRQLADRYAQKGNAAAAIPLYQEILKASPDDFLAATSLAQLLVQANRDTEAIPLYVNLLKQPVYGPEVQAQIRVKIGGIYEKRGNKTEAVGQYRAALELNPKESTAQEGLKRLGEK